MARTLVMLPWPRRMKSTRESLCFRTANESESIMMGHWPEEEEEKMV